MTRARLRDLGISIGRFRTGRYNAITDVPDVLVGHCTLIYDKPRIARTGITLIVPRRGDIWRDQAFAGIHIFNGSGDMTGIQWLMESGLLSTPIALTNTNQAGLVRDELIAYAQSRGLTTIAPLPVVAETWDGWLNDIDAYHLDKTHILQALDSARSGPVMEGNVGGGTGMICHDLKGGIGTSSRIVVGPDRREYTIGVLVQANHGDRHMLRVDGAPIGLELGSNVVPMPWDEPLTGGSIIGVIATDAPLNPTQCQRLAQRAVLGLARSGGLGHDGSGDMFIAFSTANHIPAQASDPISFAMLPNSKLNPFFEAVGDATEEAILNSLTAAETMQGYLDRVAYELPLDQLARLMKKYGRG